MTTPHPIQRPSLGRAVHFTQTLARSNMPGATTLPGLVDAREYAAFIAYVDHENHVLYLQVLTTDPAHPVRVVLAPLEPDAVDTWGSSWRWPPRV